MKLTVLPVTLLSLSLTSQASVVTFTFDDSLNLQSTWSATVSGITLTLSNANSNSGTFAADSDGVLLSNDPSLGATSFQMSFSSAVQVTGYSIGFVLDPTSGTFTLSRTGASSSGNDLSAVGSHSLNGTFTVAANEPITLTSNPSGFPGWSQIKSFEVNTAVPEPAEAAVWGAAVCGVFAWMRRLRR